jgi:hypothetical protein
VALPVPAMPTAAQAVALGAKYGPQSAMAFQRSQYLADALERMQADTNNIRTPQALWADLLAEGITGWSKSRADKDAMAAYGADQKTLHDNLTAGTPLDPSYQPPAGGGSLMSGDAMMPPPPSAAAPSPRAVGPTTPQDPQGRDLLARMILGEAGGEGDVGERAAGHVAMNRVASGWGGAHTLADVISAPHQFEGLHSAQASVAPTDPHYQHAASLADAIMGGQDPDPTNGATQFLNPQLQAQLGRQQPAWATGQGQQIGHHVFYGGQPQGGAPQVPPGQMGGGVPPPPPPPDPNGPSVQPAPQGAPQPFQVAANGPLQPGMVPGGGAGGAPLPAGPAAPPPSPGGAAAPQIPHQTVTPQEWAEAERLWQNPQTREAGMQEMLKLRMRAASPVEMKPGTYFDPQTGQARSVEQFQDQPGAPNSFIQRSSLDGSIHAQANPAYGALPAGTAMGAQGGISQVPIQQQKTFRIQGANGIFVNGPDGRPVKVGDDQYGPEQLFGLRKQVMESDAYKNYQSAQDAWGAMRAAASQPTGGMRAYALRDTFARLINPGAVARVGTIQAIAEAQGLPAEIKGFLMNLRGDGNVPPEIAQQIMDVSQGFLASHYQGAQALNQSNTDFAKRHGIDPQDVTAPMGPPPERFVIPNAAPASGGAGQLVTLPDGSKVPLADLQAEARRRGLTK